MSSTSPRELVVDELKKMNPWARAVADEIESATVYEPNDDDIVELARALDHLRNLATLPSKRPIVALRDNLVARFPSRTYRVIPEDGSDPYKVFSYGPIHAPPDSSTGPAVSGTSSNCTTGQIRLRL